MPYPRPDRLVLPVGGYAVTGRAFLEEAVIGGEAWGIHLGEDVLAPPGTPVCAVGDGVVVYAALCAGRFRRRGSWGNVVILGHTHAADGRLFYSVYGHLGERYCAKGNRVACGEAIGTVGAGRTRANGWWPESHLHFAIYRGPWEGRALPGYFREDDGRTKREHWRAPSEFVRAYQPQSSRALD